jgi:hypothetical protein
LCVCMIKVLAGIVTEISVLLLFILYNIISYSSNIPTKNNKNRSILFQKSLQMKGIIKRTFKIF